MTRSILKRGAVIAALVGAFSVSTSNKAEAAFYAAICNDAACDGTGDVIVQDGSVNDMIFNGTPGAIVIGGSMGGLTVLVNTSQSKPILGSAAAPRMDLTYTVSGTGTVWLYATDTDFTGVTPVSGQVDGNHIDGQGHVTAFIAGGNDNTNFTGPGATNLDLSSMVSASDNVGDTHISLMKPFGGANPYFLTIGLRIERESAGTSTGDYKLVPEPASLSLFGLGLAGLAALRRRRAAR